MIKTCLLLLVFGLVHGAEMDHLTSLRGVDYLSLKSTVNDHQYHVFIKAPDTGQATPAGGYPVVVLLDGGNLFPMLAAYHQYLEMSEELPPVIMVGLSYGTNDWQKGNKRSTDYTLPARDRAHYGGAALFRNMLMTELMPLIEASYPVDEQLKILMGHSIGGQFALYEAMFQAGDFYGLIASNPAIHRNTEAFLKPPKTTAKRPRLFIMQADGDDDVFRFSRQQWLDHWQNKPHHWTMKVETIAGHNHMSSVPAAYRQGMLWLLNNNHNNSK